MATSVLKGTRQDIGKVLTAIFVIAMIFLIRWIVPPPKFDEELGCETMERLEGWSSCELVDHSSSVDLRGCDKRDRHSYTVRGKGSRGFPARAIVCCRDLHGGCRVGD